MTVVEVCSVMMAGPRCSRPAAVAARKDARATAAARRNRHRRTAAVGHRVDATRAGAVRLEFRFADGLHARRHDLQRSIMMDIAVALPMLLRENAAHNRRRLAARWSDTHPHPT